MDFKEEPPKHDAFLFDDLYLSSEDSHSNDVELIENYAEVISLDSEDDEEEGPNAKIVSDDDEDTSSLDSDELDFETTDEEDHPINEGPNIRKSMKTGEVYEDTSSLDSDELEFETTDEEDAKCGIKVENQFIVKREDPICHTGKLNPSEDLSTSSKTLVSVEMHTDYSLFKDETNFKKGIKSENKVIVKKEILETTPSQTEYKDDIKTRFQVKSEDILSAEIPQETRYKEDLKKDVKIKLDVVFKNENSMGGSMTTEVDDAPTEIRMPGVNMGTQTDNVVSTTTPQTEDSFAGGVMDVSETQKARIHSTGKYF